MCSNIGTPKNQFKIWNKWKFYYLFLGVPIVWHFTVNMYCCFTGTSFNLADGLQSFFCVCVCGYLLS